MGNPLVMLILQLLGAGTVMVAVAMLLARIQEYQSLRAAALPAGVLALGAGMSLAAWLFRPDPTLQDDPQPLIAEMDTLLSDLPPTAGGMPRYDHIRVRVAGTPSDRDTATAEFRQAYARQLGALVANDLVAEGLASRADASTADPLNGGCDQKLCVTVYIPAVPLAQGSGYARWREPLLELHGFEDGRVERRRFRVQARPGDVVPYEQALRERVLAEVRNLP